MSSAETAGALQPRHCFALSQPEPEFRWSDLSPIMLSKSAYDLREVLKDEVEMKLMTSQ